MRLAAPRRALAVIALATGCAALAQPAPLPPADADPAVAAHRQRCKADPMAVPGFWDPRRRPERPDLSRISVIRFLTEVDYPPFDYAGPDGNPAGFNVDLARHDLRGDQGRLHDADAPLRHADRTRSTSNDGDAVIASIAATPEMRQRVDFSDPYYRTPARFVSRKDSRVDDVAPEALEGKKVAVVAGTAHEAYLKALFTEAELQPYPTAEAARAALKKGEVDLLFGDGIALVVLAQRHRLRRLLRLPRRPLSRKPLLRRGRRHRGEARQRSVAAGVQLGAVPAVGERPVYRSVAALFPDQPVLIHATAPLAAATPVAKDACSR